MIDFNHPKLNEEITAIGGHYVFIKEGRLAHASDQILYHVGYAVIDTSCCGSSGMPFASVAGWIRNWHWQVAGDGQPVSRVEPIPDAAVQSDIRRIICDKESVLQVNFL